MREFAVAGDGVPGGAPGEGPTAAVPCPRCGRPPTWVLRDQGTFHSVEQLRADCDCDLTDDEWLDLGGEAYAQLEEERG